MSEDMLLGEMIRQMASDCERLAALEKSDSSRPYALRGEMLRKWLEDRNTNVSLVQKVDAMAAELQCARKEIIALNLELGKVRADAEARKDACEFLKNEVVHQEAITKSKNSVIAQMKGTVANQDARIHELRTELNKVQEELRVEQGNCATLRQPYIEQIAVLQDEIDSLKAAQSPRSSQTLIVSPKRQQTSPGVFEPEASTSRRRSSRRDVCEIDLCDDEGPLNAIPASRREELQKYPEVVPDIDESAVFSRGFLSANLGGNHQQLIVRIDQKKPKPLAAKYSITKFLCPNLTCNPWCPRAPGQHGFMFVGLGNESETFLVPETLNLFISVPANNAKLDVLYLGVYEVCRVAPLTVTEWRSLSPVVQASYVDLTAKRTESNAKKSDMIFQRIEDEYNTGTRFVPCVRLRCIWFDKQLYDGMVANFGADLRIRDVYGCLDIGGPSPMAKRRRLE